MIPGKSMQHRTTIALRTRALGKRFGRRWALAHLELEVREGEALFLAGANGSGKTTLLKLLCGLYRPTTGEVEIFGRDPVAERLTCRKRLSLVGHDSYLFERLSALESLRYWTAILDRPKDEDALLGLLEEVGLEDRSSSLVGTFSAGMKKRLAFARSRLENPSLLLLDEPFAALDVSGQRQVESWIRRGREQGLTIIVASHQLEQTARICDRAALLRDGQLTWIGSAADLPGAFEEHS